MGTTPSKTLHKSVKKGDVEGVRKALGDGAAVDAVESRRTPLMQAAYYSRPNIVQLLLQEGASDYRDGNQELALHIAARMGSVECCAALIQRGSDHFAKNRYGLRPIHVASAAGKVAAVRGLERLTCPFFHEVQVKNPIFLSLCTWHERWMTVHRAGPHDNPIVPRGDSILYVFTTNKYSTSYAEVRNPVVQVKRTEEAGTLVRFDVVSGVQLTAANNPNSAAVGSLECKAPLHVFEWLRDILHPDYGNGRGPWFDGAGRRLLPPWGQRNAAGDRLHPMPRPADILAARRRAARQGEVQAEVVPPPPIHPPVAPATPAELMTEAGMAAATNAYGAAHSMMGPRVADSVFPTSVSARHAAQRAAARQPSHPGPAAAASGGAAASAPQGAACAPPHALAPSEPTMYPTLAGYITQPEGGGQGEFDPLPPRHTMPASASPAPAPPAPLAPSPAPLASSPAPLAPLAPAPAPVTSAVPAAPVLDTTLPPGAEEPPPGLCCILTMDLYTDPVVAADGHTYDRAALEQWLADKNTSPKTNLPLPHKFLVPNMEMRGRVVTWVEEARRAAVAPAPAPPAAAAVAAPAPSLVPDKGVQLPPPSPRPIAPSAPAAPAPEPAPAPVLPSPAAEVVPPPPSIDISAMPLAPSHAVGTPQAPVQSDGLYPSGGTYAVLD